MRMDFLAHHILSVVLFTPLLGALVLLLIPREMEHAHKIAGNVFGALGFLVSLPLLRWFKPGWGGFAFEETADWIPSIGAKYHLGIDGISLLLVMLTTFLGMIAILSSWSAIHLRTKEYYILLLLLQTGMLGVFVSLDFFLFYVFWEVMLVPMYFLIGVWGSDRRLYAAIKFFLYTLAGSVVMLLAILALTPNGLSGSVLQQINHGISTGALFLIVGVLYERRHTRMISEFGGLATPMPNFAAIYLIISLSSLGMPLLNGFIGEFTILQGAFQVSKAWAAWGSLGVVLGAAYLLWLYQRVMFGPVTQVANEELPDLNLREYATLVPLVILAFWIGIYPKPFFNLIEKPVQRIVEQVNPNFYPVEHAKLPSAEIHAAAAESK